MRCVLHRWRRFGGTKKWLCHGRGASYRLVCWSAGLLAMHASSFLHQVDMVSTKSDAQHGSSRTSSCGEAYTAGIHGARNTGPNEIRRTMNHACLRRVYASYNPSNLDSTRLDSRLLLSRPISAISARCPLRHRQLCSVNDTGTSAWPRGRHEDASSPRRLDCHSPHPRPLVSLRISSFICFLEKYPDWICNESSISDPSTSRKHAATPPHSHAATPPV
jgi:hypothetical protein